MEKSIDLRAERASQFLIVAGALIGLTVCVTTVLSWTAGIFMPALENAYGWKRGDIALGVSLHTATIFLGSALVGRLADQVNPGKLAAVSMAAFGGGLIAVSFLIHDIFTLWMAYILLTVIGLGTAPVVLLKPVVSAFTVRRGLALGIAMSGTGIGAFLLPPYVASLIDGGDWRLGYRGLGWIALIVAPILWMTLGRRSGILSNLVAPGAATQLAGMDFSEAWRTPTFWLLSIITVTSGFGMGGTATHIIPYLTDQGVAVSDAAFFASILGIGSISGRLIGGFALDAVQRPAIGTLFLGSGVAGIMTLFFFGAPAAAIAALLIGFMIGAEIDLVAYFTSRYFGMRAHATIFGWNYGMIALGSSSAPFIVGLLRDHHGNYDIGFSIAAAFILVGALTCLMLGRYRYDTH